MHLPKIDYCVVGDCLNRIRKNSYSSDAITRCVDIPIDLVKLIVLALFELGVHLITGASKLSLGVVQLIAKPVFRNVAPQKALFEAGSHIFRSAKLAFVVLCVPFIGLIQPRGCNTLYSRLALVKQPFQYLAVIKTLRWLGKLPFRPWTPGTFASVCLVAARRHIDFTPKPQQGLPVFGLLTGVALVVTGIAAVCCLRSRCVRSGEENKIRPPQPQPEFPAPDHVPKASVLEKVNYQVILNAYTVKNKDEAEFDRAIRIYLALTSAQMCSGQLKDLRQQLAGRHTTSEGVNAYLLGNSLIETLVQIPKGESTDAMLVDLSNAIGLVITHWPAIASSTYNDI